MNWCCEIFSFFSKLCPTMWLLKDFVSRKMTFWQFVHPYFVHFAKQWKKWKNKYQIFSFWARPELGTSRLSIIPTHMKMNQHISDEVFLRNFKHDDVNALGKPNISCMLRSAAQLEKKKSSSLLYRCIYGISQHFITF